LYAKNAAAFLPFTVSNVTTIAQISFCLRFVFYDRPAAFRQGQDLEQSPKVYVFNLPAKAGRSSLKKL
jgi:hypothetical protein